MTPELTFLTEQQIPDIHFAHIEAFSDYQIDMSYMTQNRMKSIENVKLAITI